MSVGALALHAVLACPPASAAPADSAAVAMRRTIASAVPTHTANPWDVALHVLRATVLAADDKQRVPKPPPPPPPRTKPGAPAPAAEEEDDESSDCFASCLFSIFDSMIGSDRESAPVATAIAPGPHSWVPGEQGWLQADPGENRIEVWNAPGGEMAGARITGHVPAGVRIVILEIHASVGGLWIRVRPVDGTEPVGWVADRTLTDVAPAPEEPSRPPPAPRAETWAVSLAVGPGLVGPSDLDLEYGDGGLRLALAGSWRGTPGWHFGIGTGYRNQQGSPRVNYVTPSRIDDARESALEIFDVSLSAGQRFGRQPRGARLEWALEPGLYYVFESAQIHELDPSTLVDIGQREESRGLWRGGAALRLGVGRRENEHFEWGLRLEGHAIHWRGSGTLSLTTDFLGRKTIHGFDATIYAAFLGR